MSFRLVPKSVTLNDLERRNRRYFALFHRIRLPFRAYIHKLSTTEMYSPQFLVFSYISLTMI